MRTTSLRRTLALVASSLVTFSAGTTVAVLVATSAAAASPAKSPADRFFVVNATVNAASIHVVGGSSAFPNFATGAVDNYYALAHSHVDNSPAAEGRASPFDTGPVGQTAAAGHFQQPQYAEARWPGGADSGKATYGKQGEPYAVAEASEYKATAEASEASHRASGPSGSSSIPVPKELDDRLRAALAEWKATWLDRLDPKKPADAAPTPKAPPVTIPKAPAIATPKTPAVTTPKAPAVPTPPAPVPTPTAPVGGSNTTPPPAPVLPPPPLPGAGTKAPSRSLAAVSTPAPSPSADGGSLLESSTLATLDAESNALVTKGESSLGRVSLGGGQIVIKGIHVSASIENDGSPTHKVAVTVAAATIGGVPVTIAEDGVHVAGQVQGLPYQQASDALNGALKQAGIQVFLVAPQVTTDPCAEQGSGAGSSTTSTPSDEASSCGQTGTPAACEQTGTGTGTGTTTTTTTGTTTTTPLPTPTPTPPRDDDEPDTTTTTSSCDGMGTAKLPTSSCVPAGTATGTKTTSNSSTGATTTTNAIPLPGTTTATTTTESSDQMSAGAGTTGPGQESAGQLTVRATGVHIAFTQPENQSGVPTQNVEHILGEVFLDSLAVPAGPLPDLGLAAASSSAASSSSSCPGAGGSAGTGAASGASLVGGGSSGSLAPSASGFTSGSQPISGSSSGSASGSGWGSGGTSLPATLASALRKPLWLLLAYVLWQALVIGTGVSVWNWRRGEAS